MRATVRGDCETWWSRVAGPHCRWVADPSRWVTISTLSPELDVPMNSPFLRPRRSCLYMPGANQRALDKAASLPADVLLLDLEEGPGVGDRRGHLQSIPDNTGIRQDRLEPIVTFVVQAIGLRRG